MRMAARKLCFLASEMTPFAKTGGLADVAGALVRELCNAGHDVRAFMPLYGTLRDGPWQLQDVAAVSRVALPIGALHYEFSLRAAAWPGADRTTYFVDCPQMFDRGALYTQDADEYRRFLLFTRAVVESCQRLAFAPDIFHCNDWHTALLPLLLKSAYSWDRLFANSRTVLTIHNIAFQGIMPADAAADLQSGPGEPPLDPEDLAQGFINSLKIGIRFADAVTTVSPTYAREICAGPLGMGLQKALRRRVDGVTGILNGVDYEDWDPRHDRYLTVQYGAGDWRGKLANKRALIAAEGLDIGPAVPLFGMVGRLTEQKGIDLLLQVLPAFLQRSDCALLVLGSGEARYAAFFEMLAGRFPGRVAFHFGFDEARAHLIEAGSDAFLMPSRYEPCGLNQMYSMRYGTIPVVHKTGGLADSVVHFDAATRIGTGCVFKDFDGGAVEWALQTTLDWFADRTLWRRLMQNAMAADFSWRLRIPEYEALYERVGALAPGT